MQINLGIELNIKDTIAIIGLKMEEDTSRNFKFNNNGSVLEINIDDENKAECPMCERKFKQLVQHIKQSKQCVAIIDFDKFKDEYKAFANRRRKNKWYKEKGKTERLSKLEANAVGIQKQRKRRLEADVKKVHLIEASHTREQRDKRLNNNAKTVHHIEASQTREHRNKRLNANAKKVHRIEAANKQKQITNEKQKITEADRLRKYRRAVLFGPIFVCSCCHVKHFESNVALLDNNLEGKLLEKFPDCYAECVKQYGTKSSSNFISTIILLSSYLSLAMNLNINQIYLVPLQFSPVVGLLSM